MTTGIYCGKFFPMHKGHAYCVEQALKYCDKLYLVLIVGGQQEKDLASTLSYLTKEFRWDQVCRVAAKFPGRVIPKLLDVSDCYDSNGNEDWDAETPKIAETCGNFDYAFGSELSYKAYFDKAFPKATYILIDPDRTAVNICATKLREDFEQYKNYLV